MSKTELMKEELENLIEEIEQTIEIAQEKTLKKLHKFQKEYDQKHNEGGVLLKCWYKYLDFWGIK